MLPAESSAMPTGVFILTCEYEKSRVGHTVYGVHMVCSDPPTVCVSIPKGTPINLLANVDPSLDSLFKLIPAVNAAVAAVAATDIASGKSAGTRSAGGIPPSLVRALMSASKCPDLVEDRGHEFGASLSDSDKRALIEFLKTL